VTPLFHIVDADDWARAEAEGAFAGSTRGRTLTDEGFIHCSLAHQVEAVANLVYGGVGGLLLLTIDPERVHAPIRYDPAETGEEFPHIYGPLNIDAVVAVQPFTPGPDGHFHFP
jgi:glutathione S-transferase